MKFCVKCGYKLEDDDAFCPKCGTKSEPLNDEEKIIREEPVQENSNDFIDPAEEKEISHTGAPRETTVQPGPQPQYIITPAFAQPSPVQAPRQKRGLGLAIAGMVLGIIGVIFLVTLFYVVGVSGVYDETATTMVMAVLNIILFTVILALLSFIFSLIGMIKGITSRHTAAIVIGAIGLVLSLVLCIIFILLFAGT